MISVEFKIPHDKAHMASDVLNAIEAELATSSSCEFFTVSITFGDSIYPVYISGGDIDQLWIMDEIKKAVHRVGCAAMEDE